MKKYIKALSYLSILLGSSAHALSTAEEQACGCDHVISTYSWSVDGNISNFQPADTVCLDASVDYGSMKWEHINGTKEDPIVIKNCAGQVYINAHSSTSASHSYGWRFYNSKFFKILGNGDSQHQYGIKVSTPKGFHVTMERFTTNFEIANVEVAGISSVIDKNTSGFAGIGVKTQPRCDGKSDRDVWTMHDVNIHDNYIHHVGGEGLYIGYGRYDGFINQDTKTSCVGRKMYPHAIRGLRVFNNIVKNVGYDGIQVKNADSNVAIYNNFISDYGLLENGNHDEGLFIGDGTEALIYNNWVDNGLSIKKGHGIQLNGFGNTKVFNNVVINLGVDVNRTLQPAYNKKSSLYLNNNSNSYSSDKNGTFEIYNNTFIGAQDYGIEAYTGQKIMLHNNIFTEYRRMRSISSNATLIKSANIFEQNASLLDFIDFPNKDFNLQSTSIAVGTGVNKQLAFDYNHSRRVDNVFDIGAYEYGGISASGIPSLTIVTPSLNTPIKRKAVFVEVELKNASNSFNNIEKVQYILNDRLIGTDVLPRVTEHWIGGQRFKVGDNDFYAIGTHFNGEITRSPSINIRVYD
ncbi:MAG: Unknown protein [uncultured Sulfurovum sp.]|uniref:Right handed beta helix domain-containing protein n=1 Tax=uncultured Sulfurovum sp. TaxID=269237 RepID=A0A6S6TZV1_9BACT|nr:MAG: Unknown protein [uncultured Sulfurovum sp.]